MISTEYRGTTEGNTFDDSSIMKDLTNAALTRIIVYHHNFIHSLTVSCLLFLLPTLAKHLRLK